MTRVHAWRTRVRLCKQPVRTSWRPFYISYYFLRGARRASDPLISHCHLSLNVTCQWAATTRACCLWRARAASGTRNAPIQHVRSNTPAVARLRQEESNFGGCRSCAPTDGHGSGPRMHLDGMKQEEVWKSNLLCMAVAVCQTQAN